jgi:hypothetical protein
MWIPEVTVLERVVRARFATLETTGHVSVGIP